MPAAPRPADPRFRSGPPAEPAAAPTAVPAALGGVLAGAMWEQVWVKEGTEVWRAAVAGAVRYVKIGGDDGADGVADEAERLGWLAGRAAVPEVLAHHRDGDGRAWLVTAEVPGVPAHDPGFALGSVEPLLEALGQGLRRLHDTLPVDACPFDARLDVLLARSRARVRAGKVDVDALEPAYRRLTPDQILDHLHATRPPEPAEDLVVAHGDPCLPNLLVDPAALTLSGLVDVGRLGVSDRYRDLAIVARSLVANVGPEVASRFFDAYGLSRPDLLRLEYYVLLDELW